ncbi:MAG TPA: SDR family oxidoreductase [Acetobacteraceae bacterium]|nr:SDR family oxidoreductase [Acetobacteraceae bacterium]
MGMLDGKVAIITGSTSGIGARAAELFVAEGANVIIAGRRAVRGQELAEKLGPTAHYIQTDVSKESDVVAMVAGASARFGRLDCLVNNAGVPGPGGSITELDVAGYDAAMAVLLRGVFLGIKHAAPIMMQQGQGSIINIGSVAGSQAGYGGYTYSAAKAAVIHLTRCMAMELGPRNVRVNSISPGAIVTGIFGKAFGVADDVADRTAAVLEEDFAKAQPIPRAGKPEDIAQAAAWLASDASTFVNGRDLVVDGGLLVGRPLSMVLATAEAIAAKVTAAAGAG